MVSLVSGATGYTWSVPASWMIIAGQGTNQIMVNAGSTSGSISVKAQNQYGESGSRHEEVRVTTKVPAKPVAVTGPISVCTGSEATYSVPVMEDTRKYNWTLPAGWSIVGLRDTSHIKVVVGTEAGVIRVTAENPCGRSAATELVIAVSQPISSNTIQGSQSVCAGQAPAMLEGSTPAGGNGTYTYSWEASITSATDGFVPAAGPNESQQYTSGILSNTTWFRRVVSSGACGVSYSEAVKVEVKPLPARPTIEQVGAQELRASLEGDHYEWVRDDVKLASSTRSITVKEGGAYKVRVRNAQGCFSAYSDVWQVTITGLADEARAMGFVLYPNPSNGRVLLTTREPLLQVEVQVINMLGHAVHRQQLPQVTEQLELKLGHLPDGVYLLQLRSSDRQLKQRLLLQR